ncbi:MAG: M23 family metallopeptidase [Ornithinimicrobium sp.]
MSSASPLVPARGRRPHYVPKHRQHKSFPRSTGAARLAIAVLVATSGTALVLESTGVTPRAHAEVTARLATGQVDAVSLSERNAPVASRSGGRPRAQSIDLRSRLVGVPATLAGETVHGALGTTFGHAQTVRDSLTPRYVAPIRDARVTSGFGPRWGRMHQGMDFGADIGHPLVSVADGRVTTAGYNRGLGHHVRITLDDGTEVTYGHLSVIGVEQGSTVEAGDVIGEVGNSGSSTGAHLHFEVRAPDGEAVDPRPWLTERGLLG